MNPGSISGTVMAAGGAPAGSAAVYLRNPADGRLTSNGTFTADGSGAFVMPRVMPRDYEITASSRTAPDDEIGRVLVTVVEGQNTPVAIQLSGIVIGVFEAPEIVVPVFHR